MLEKKGSSSSGLPSDAIQPTVQNVVQDSVEVEETEKLTPNDEPHSQSHSAKSTTSSIFHQHQPILQPIYKSENFNLGDNFRSIQNPNSKIPDECEVGIGTGTASILLSVERRSKSKESYHSSDEVIDEEDLLAISDSDYVDTDIPIIPGIVSAANTSDVDSAFEDSHYSGSSDDKNRNKGNSAKNHVLKNKSRRRSGNGRHSGTSGNLCASKHKSNNHQHQTIAEITPGNEEDAPTFHQEGSGSGQVESGRDSGQGANQNQGREIEEMMASCGLHDFHHQLNEPEPVLFEMEVSPANHPQEILMPALLEDKLNSNHDFIHNYNPEELESTYKKRPRNHNTYSASNTNRHVHYHGHSPDSMEMNIDTGESPPQALLNEIGENGSDHYGAENVDENEDLNTILLLPPVPSEVYILRILDTSENSSPRKVITKLTSESSDYPPHFVGEQTRTQDQLLNANKLSLAMSPVGTRVVNIPEGGTNRDATAPIGSSGSKEGKEIESGENSEDYEVVYVVPDGGWGWMVLFGSILVNILIPGTVKSFGILFVEFLEVFKASPTAASWIPALSYWLYSSMGPFASALAIKYSHRSVTIVGGLLASCGLMLSYFATSISYLYISYGIIGGLGAGLAYPVGVFMVGQYFEKRRGLANGLCTSGSALGSVLIPPLLRILLVEYGYRGAILIMGGILLNVCVGAMFYDPVSKHMKKQLIPREKSKPLDDKVEEQEPVKPAPPRQVTSPIPRMVQAPIREVAASMPIAIPLPPHNITDFRDVRDRRGSNSGRKATFQIGHEDADSWSVKSMEVASPLAARLVKEDIGNVGTSSPKWSLYNPGGIRVRGHLPCSNDSNPELEVLIHSNSTGAMTTPCGTALSLSGMGASRGQSRLNLTAIPEDDDTASDCTSRQVDWSFYSALPAAKQRLLRLSVGGGTQLMGSQGSQPNNLVMNAQPGLRRTMSVASNASNSSFHYMNTIHHGSILSAMQMDKNLPEFASTLTLKSVRNSCCPRLSTLKQFCRKLTCGLWPKLRANDVDEQDEGMIRGKERDCAKLGRTERLKKFIDFSLLQDGMYLIMLASNSTTAVGYTNFIVLLPSYALAMGFDKSEAAALLSIVAAFDFIGRIGGAGLSDLQFISRKWYYIIGLFLSGVALAFLPYARTYSSLVTMCSIFGLASGTYIGVTAVILADQLGAEKLGSSYGISLFLNGLLQLIGPPICGALFEHTGHLEPIFTGLGITLITGALFWIWAPFIERRRARKSKANATAIDNLNSGRQPPETGGNPIVQNGNVTRSETSLV